MKDIFTMWRSTRMIVLTAICAAVYVAVLIPFKILTIVPGFTEVRPGAIVPVVCSILFGPAAAWGAGFGNVIGDFIGGMFGFGSIFGFLGNFLLGYIPYKILSQMGRYEPALAPKSKEEAPKFAWTALLTFLISGIVFILAVKLLSRFGALAEMSFVKLVVLDCVFMLLSWMFLRSPKFGLAAVVACAACATIIGWGVHLIGVPFPFTGIANIIFLNNLSLNCILTPIVLALIHKRVKDMGLLYTDVLGIEAKGLSFRFVAGVALMTFGAVGGLIVGNLATTGHLAPALPVTVTLSPFFLCMVFALVLL